MPVSDQTPNVVLVDSSEIPMEVSGGIAIPNGTKGLLVAGVQANGSGSYLSLDSTGSLTTNQGNPATLSAAWPVKLTSGSKEVGTENYPLSIKPAPYFATDFGEFRTATLFTLVDLVNKYGLDTFEYGTQTTGSGGISANPNQSALILSASSANGDRAILRTNTFFRYQAGKEQIVKISAYHADKGRTNQIRRWGLYDDQDGLFFAVSGTNFGIYKRSSVTGVVNEIFISQSSFNRDPLNGSGQSGITLDLTKGNIYETHFQWLGVGTVKFYINGVFVHNLDNTNTNAGPYMKNGQLPLSWEISNNGASTASNFTYICSSVLSVGGDTPPNVSFCAFNSTAISVGVTERPVLSLRPKLSFSGTENRMLILPSLFSISTEGSRISYRVVLNPTSFTGAAFTNVNARSGAEFDVSATAIVGGETIYYGFLPNSNDSQQVDLSSFFEILGRKLRTNAFGVSADTICILAVNEAAGTTLVKAALTWREIR